MDQQIFNNMNDIGNIGSNRAQIWYFAEIKRYDVEYFNLLRLPG